MRKNTSIFIATHAWFDEEKFPRAKSENGSSKNKLEIHGQMLMHPRDVSRFSISGRTRFETIAKLSYSYQDEPDRSLG